MIACLFVLTFGSAGAEELAGPRFSEQVTIGGERLVLNGVGVRSATLFNIKVYVAGLYVQERTPDAAVILRPDRSKYLLAVMRRDVSREDSAPVFREGVERSAGPDAPALRSETLAFERWIPSMRKGQELSVAFVPGVGVTVQATGKEEVFRGSIRFGTALFGMWIGPLARDDELRRGLLRKASPSGP